jgi:hypothetical protein
MVSDWYDSRLTPCPRCRYSDAVLSVPAAYISASSTEAARRVMNDSEATIARRHAARVTVNAALPIVSAKDLALAPGTFPGCAGCLGIFFGIAAIGALTAYQTLTDHNSGDSALLVVGAIAGLLSLFGISQLPRALTRQRKVKAGKPAAEAIWRLGWYCCRCAIVYFQAGEAPSGVRSGQPLTPAQFQHIVWSAGRYDKST